MNLFKLSGSSRTFRTPQMSFIIFASPKSGTTWLQRLISAHPDAVCAESRPFGEYHSANPSATPHLTLERYCEILTGHFAPAIPATSPDNAGFRRTLAHRFLNTLAETALEATGKSVYGEKFTPFRGTAGHAIAEIQQYNPDINFINLTRDGRDVIASGAAHWLNLRLRHAHPPEREKLEEILRCHMILPEDFEMFLEYWSEAAESGLEARKMFSNYLHVRYEDFVEAPICQATKLLKFIGLKSDAQTVRACVESASFNRLSGGRTRGEEDINSFFRKGIVGDWKNWFTAEQHAAFDRIAGHLLTKLGYDRASVVAA